MKGLLIRLMPVEWILLVCGLGVVFTYHVLGLPMPGEPGAALQKGPLPFFIKQLLASLDLYCVVLFGFVAVQLFLVLRRHHFRVRRIEWRPFWKHIAQRFDSKHIIQDVRFMNAVLVMFIEFALLKNLIPHVNGRVFDDWFLASDELVCGGMVCSQLLDDG